MTLRRRHNASPLSTPLFPSTGKVALSAAVDRHSRLVKTWLQPMMGRWPEAQCDGIVLKTSMNLTTHALVAASVLRVCAAMALGGGAVGSPLRVAAPPPPSPPSPPPPPPFLLSLARVSRPHPCLPGGRWTQGTVCGHGVVAPRCSSLPWHAATHAASLYANTAATRSHNRRSLPRLRRNR